MASTLFSFFFFLLLLHLTATIATPSITANNTTDNKPIVPLAAAILLPTVLLVLICVATTCWCCQVDVNSLQSTLLQRIFGIFREVSEDARVEIRKYRNIAAEESRSELMGEVSVQDCPSWNNLGGRIYEVWQSVNWNEGDDVPEDVNPSSCWPGYEVSYWTAADPVRERVCWTQADWDQAKHTLSLVRLVPAALIPYNLV